MRKTLGYSQSVLLAIHKNWNRSILLVVPSIYQNAVENLTVQIRIRCQRTYCISRSIEGTTLIITKFMPLKIAIVVPSLKLVG